MCTAIAAALALAVAAAAAPPHTCAGGEGAPSQRGAWGQGECNGLQV